MTDKKIIELFFARSQAAVDAVKDKYGGSLLRLADNLLGNRLDAEECVNDALLTAWNAIPPQRPESLGAWLYSTVRNLAMNRCRINCAKKRGGGEWASSLEELREVASPGDGPEQALDAEELAAALNNFFRGLAGRDRLLLMGRYYAGESYGSLAQRLGMTEESCQVRVHRLRKKLKAKLKKEGLL